jgi:hypothetical protein
MIDGTPSLPLSATAPSHRKYSRRAPERTAASAGESPDSSYSIRARRARLTPSRPPPLPSSSPHLRGRFLPIAHRRPLFYGRPRELGRARPPRSTTSAWPRVVVQGRIGTRIWFRQAPFASGRNRSVGGCASRWHAVTAGWLRRSVAIVVWCVPGCGWKGFGKLCRMKERILRISRRTEVALVLLLAFGMTVPKSLGRWYRRITLPSAQRPRSPMRRCITRCCTSSV